MPSTRDEQLPSEATAKKTYLIQTDTLKATAVAKLPTASHQRHVNTTIALDINTALRADLHCFVLRLKESCRSRALSGRRNHHRQYKNKDMCPEEVWPRCSGWFLVFRGLLRVSSCLGGFLGFIMLSLSSIFC